jgi:type i restriction enzyme ecoR124II specificity protein
MGKRVVDSTINQITEAAVRNSSAKLVPARSIAMVVRSSILDHTFPTALVPVIATLNQDMRAVAPSNEIVPNYLAHILNSRGNEILRTAKKSGGSVASIDSAKLLGFRVPIPPLEVQREIVRVLDKFTQLEAELEAELEARRRQYEYYRDHLLTFSEEATLPILPLGEVALIVRGASPRPIRKFLTSDKSGVPWIKIGDVAAEDKYITTTTERVTEAGAAKSRRVSPGDFVLSNSMSFGRPFIMKIEGCVHDGWLVISNFDKSFVPDFLYHLLRSQPIQEEFVRRAGSGGAVSNLNSDTVKALTVPIPPLQEQRRIVSILDKFDSLVNDLSIGLPAELAARRKQYEYYRDRLLTFEEKR